MKWLALVVLLASFSGVAHAAPGPVVSISVPGNATLRVSLLGDSVEASGALPIVLPFDLSFSQCTASGTATLANLNGGLELQVANGSLAADFCQLKLELVQIDLIVVEIPNAGDAVTPIYAFAVGTTTGSADVHLNLFQGGLGPDYLSVVLEGAAQTAAPSWLDSPTAVAAGPSFYPAGDTIAASVETLEAQWINESLAGVANFEGNVRFELFLPSTAGFAAPALSDGSRAALTALLVGVTGLVFARRRR